jgi:hypothetical protein
MDTRVPKTLNGLLKIKNYTAQITQGVNYGIDKNILNEVVLEFRKLNMFLNLNLTIFE